MTSVRTVSPMTSRGKPETDEDLSSGRKLFSFFEKTFPVIKVLIKSHNNRPGKMNLHSDIQSSHVKQSRQRLRFLSDTFIRYVVVLLRILP